ncbi:endoplasmic reticulum-based factor for assembly of V-ATPase-domain-containing protein [Paraphoma chrysanthemicola]|uniref:Endoplasmic reticulum-based factor for assembly of V-ATPase-domain-containing protein n=1 Tax=Paraphoma chrysanthemicola TaxID=798071 RepID=A0A8K0QZS3_9PLEO|nr:endoplasmic reticulum-based factor for assembly of V-ATPase-domain-containing protein [Paraphoma chrysanthemicola]
MVLLTMTPGIVRALAEAERLAPDEFGKLQPADESVLADAKPGNPISHSQLIDLSKLLKKHVSQLPHDDEDSVPTTLAALLTSTHVYTPPPPPAPQKSASYTALMARLRAEEEARTYERMLHPPPTRETFTQRFPRAPVDFSIGASAPLDSDDDLSYEEVHRQIILIINILISIVCVAVFIWVAARHWTVGKRLGLSLAGSLGIAVAEVAVYAGYVRKVHEAKVTEKKKPEIKEIVKSWVLDKGEEKESVMLSGKDKDVDGVRFRKGKHR